MNIHYFYNTFSENQRILYNMLRSADIPNEIVEAINNLLNGTDYFEAPASSKHHLAVPGGLFQHSVNVTVSLLNWTEKGILNWSRSFSPYLVGLLHDFTKVDKYKAILDENGSFDRYIYNDKAIGFGGHGEDSVCKILLKVPLTEEEAMCIRWHMGPYEKDKWREYDLAIEKYPNILWTHHADMVASKLMENYASGRQDIKIDVSITQGTTTAKNSVTDAEGCLRRRNEG